MPPDRRKRRGPGATTPGPQNHEPRQLAPRLASTSNHRVALDSPQGAEYLGAVAARAVELGKPVMALNASPPLLLVPESCEAQVPSLRPTIRLVGPNGDTVGVYAVGLGLIATWLAGGGEVVRAER